MDRLNLSGLQDPSSFHRQLQEVIGEKPEQQPISMPEYQGESKVDGITLKEYRYENGLREIIGLTVAEPNIRKWLNPVIAVHQTNLSGRKELFGQGGENPFLDYGLSLAKRGHRVFAIDLFLTGERNPINAWNPQPFYQKYPHWSVVGKDILDLTDLSYVINNYFNETEKINCIGHSQGGLVGTFFSAVENDRVSRLVANAAYFGKNMKEDFDPWQHALYKTGFLNNQNRKTCIAQNMDLVVSMAARGGAALLVVYSRDKIIENPVPADDELEKM
jgi:dienelactone hydrolase